MTTDHTTRIPTRLQVLAATAVLLERLEQQPRTASADQYRALVQQLERLLAAADGDPALDTLLESLPALAELHENRHYGVAGLCRSPLSALVPSERLTLDLLERLRFPG
jgi:hypothetical protein